MTDRKKTAASGKATAPKSSSDQLKNCSQCTRSVALVALTTAEVYKIIRGRLVAHVIVKDVLGKVTTRPYRNIGAADRAMRRARERGCAATVVMVRQDVAPLLGGDL